MSLIRWNAAIHDMKVATLSWISLLAFPACFAQQKDANWLHFSVLGVEQAGASSTQGEVRPFFDFWVTRHIPLRGGSDNDETHDKLGAFLHWWGNVRLASYPQQIESPMAQFISTGLGTTVSETKVNEFVQSAEFRTGPDFRLWQPVKDSRLSLFAGFGGVGPLNPKTGVTVYRVPDAGTPGRNQFNRAFPEFAAGGAQASTRYVAFTSPDRSRFYHQYAVGLRYTQIRNLGTASTPVHAPASVSASFGGHELVSGPSDLDSRVRYHGVVGNFEAFFPFTIGTARAYLFGRAVMAMRSNKSTTPLFLNPAISGETPVQPTDPAVHVIASPSARDVYTVGIGLDPVQLIETWVKKSQQGK